MFNGVWRQVSETNKSVLVIISRDVYNKNNDNDDDIQWHLKTSLWNKLKRVNNYFSIIIIIIMIMLMLMIMIMIIIIIMIIITRSRRRRGRRKAVFIK